MKRLSLILLLLISVLSVYASPAVKTGIEVLRDRNFDVLQGKRVGLVTNPSGVDRHLKSTIDILFEAPQVNLVALFGPEHGVRGDVYAGEKVDNTVDPATGLPVYSLYGKTRKPTPEMLKGIDVMVYDIQDVGVRSYTFISTLGLVMEACAPLDIEVVVLDRPDPLGGNKIEGCYVEQPYNSFVSQYKIPYVYGLTVGELARLINEEGMNRGQKGDQQPARCRLTVVPMSGWERSMLYEDTGLPWVLPSPNIPYKDSPMYYAASGICGELYGFMNIGIGYTLPFQVFGATWLDPDRLKARLESYALEGVSFRTIWYKPFSGSLKGQLVRGLQFFFTDYEKARITEVQFRVMQAVAELYPDKKAFSVVSGYGLFDKVCGTDHIRTEFAKTYKFDSIKDYWRKDEASFRELSQKYHIYH
ncbi:MAG: DUF1343 domain-containing protein [Bacteroidales bacterium]|nr:DUF1343 domain-containing protein [Bacteroidales bacterium]